MESDITTICLRLLRKIVDEYPVHFQNDLSDIVNYFSKLLSVVYNLKITANIQLLHTLKTSIDETEFQRDSIKGKNTPLTSSKALHSLRENFLIISHILCFMMTSSMTQEQMLALHNSLLKSETTFKRIAVQFPILLQKVAPQESDDYKQANTVLFENVAHIMQYIQEFKKSNT